MDDAVVEAVTRAIWEARQADSSDRIVWDWDEARKEARESLGMEESLEDVRRSARAAIAAYLAATATPAS